MIRIHKEIKEIVNNLGYKLLKEYIPEKGKHRRVIIKDSIGYEYDTQLFHLIEGKIPDFISIYNSKTLKNMDLWLKLNRPEFKLGKDNVYLGAMKKLKLYHNTCQEYFLANWANIQAGMGCGICHGSQVGKHNNLKYKFPEIAKEWHPTKNGNLTPQDIPYGTPRKVWWLCSKGHEYSSSVNGRTGKDSSGCKKCAYKQKESEIARKVKQWCLDNFEDVDIEHKMFINPETNRWLKCDIYIGEEDSNNGVYIEINDSQHYKFIPYWHKTKENFKYCKKLDRMKRKFARKNGQYIEIDLRKIKTIENVIENILENL